MTEEKTETKVSKLKSAKLWVTLWAIAMVSFIVIAGRTEFNQHEKRELPRVLDDDCSERALDYQIDADLIYCAILQQYKIDLFQNQIHWHKVRAMISGLKDTKLNDIIYCRTCKYDSEQKELMKAKTAWALPEKQTDSNSDLEEFNALLK